jgi:hypothetical protein
MNAIAKVLLTRELRNLILFHFGGLQHPLACVADGVLRSSSEVLAGRWSLYDRELDACSCRSCSYTPATRELWARNYMLWQASRNGWQRQFGERWHRYIDWWRLPAPFRQFGYPPPSENCPRASAN